MGLTSSIDINLTEYPTGVIPEEFIGSLTRDTAFGAGDFVEEAIEETLDMDLAPVTVQTGYVIKEGWQMFSWPWPYAQNMIEAWTAFLGHEPDGTDILIVKDSAADVYWPEYGFNGIGDFLPMEGYQLKISVGSNLVGQLLEFPPSEANNFLNRSDIKNALDNTSRTFTSGWNMFGTGRLEDMSIDETFANMATIGLPNTFDHPNQLPGQIRYKAGSTEIYIDGATFTTHFPPEVSDQICRFEQPNQFAFNTELFNISDHTASIFPEVPEVIHENATPLPGNITIKPNSQSLIPDDLPRNYGQALNVHNASGYNVIEIQGTDTEFTSHFSPGSILFFKLSTGNTFPVTSDYGKYRVRVMEVKSDTIMTIALFDRYQNDISDLFAIPPTNVIVATNTGIDDQIETIREQIEQLEVTITLDPELTPIYQAQIEDKEDVILELESQYITTPDGTINILIDHQNFFFEKIPLPDYENLPSKAVLYPQVRRLQDVVVQTQYPERYGYPLATAMYTYYKLEVPETQLNSHFFGNSSPVGFFPPTTFAQDRTTTKIRFQFNLLNRTNGLNFPYGLSKYTGQRGLHEATIKDVVSDSMLHLKNDIRWATQFSDNWLPQDPLAVNYSGNALNGHPGTVYELNTTGSDMIVKGIGTSFTEHYMSGSGILLKLEKNQAIANMPDEPSAKAAFTHLSPRPMYQRFIFSAVTEVESDIQLRCLMPRGLERHGYPATGTQLSGSRYSVGNTYTVFADQGKYTFWNSGFVDGSADADNFFDYNLHVNSTLILRFGPFGGNYLYTPPLQVKYKGPVVVDYQGANIQTIGFTFIEMYFSAGVAYDIANESTEDDPFATWILGLSSDDRQRITEAIDADDRNVTVYYQVYAIPSGGTPIQHYSDIHECSESIFTQSDLTADNYFTADITSGIHYKEDRITLDARNNILLVKDGNGAVYWPEYNFDNIGVLRPGEGYQIKFDQGITDILFPIHDEDNRPLIDR